MKKRKASALTKRVDNVITITLESIVPDFRPLLAALLLSTPDECTRIRQCYPEGHLIYVLLNAVNEFRTDHALWELYVKEGFFNEQLEHLLRVAKKNRNAGARLMPVFCEALRMEDELKIPAGLKKAIIAHIEWQRKKDGFAITDISLAGVVVVPADDVVPA